MPEASIHCFGVGDTIVPTVLDQKKKLLEIYDDQFSRREKKKYSMWIHNATVRPLCALDEASGETYRADVYLDYKPAPFDKLTNTLRPRLIYKDDKLSVVRKTLTSTRKRSWAQVYDEAQKALHLKPPEYPEFQNITDPLERKVAYKAYYKDFRKTVDEGLQQLCLAFLVTKDEAYLTPAKAIVLEIASWPTAKEDVTSVFPNHFGDEVGLSIARCLHRAFDWLYNSFSAEERELVFKACEARAAQAYERLLGLDFFARPNDSHCGRLICYLGEMGIVLAGMSPNADQWLSYAFRAMTSVYPHWGSEDGGWSEGLWYAHDYITFGLPFLCALQSAFGVNIWERTFYQNVPEFIFYCAAIRGEMEPFGDGAEMSGFASAGEHFIQLMTFFGQLHQRDPIKWWATQVNSAQAEAWELSLLFEDLGMNGSDSVFRNDLEHSKVFEKVGWAAFHSDVTKPDEDNFLLFKSSPFGSSSHSHADQNAFAIMRGGRALAIPSGYYGPAYNFPHHKNWTQSTKANNCILVNHKGQAAQSSETKGAIVDFQEKKSMTYVVGDASAAYGGKLLKWKRHILLLRPNIFMLLDEIESEQPASFQWMLHSFEQMQLGNESVKIRRNHAQLDVHLFCKSELKLSQTNQFATPYDEGITSGNIEIPPAQWHLTAETAEKSHRVRIGAIMVASDVGKQTMYSISRKSNWIYIHSKDVQYGQIKGGIQLCPNHEAVLHGKSDLDRISIKIG